jgi:TrpR-related protein YerC/YecD
MTDQPANEPRAPVASTAPASTRTSGEDRWMSDATRELASAVARLRDADEALRFLRDLCTVNELREFASRWEVARLLDAGTSYHDISERTGASSATISRVNQWLRYGRDGYRLVLDRQARARRRGR